MSKSKKLGYYKTECPICFKKIQKGDTTYTLPCKHMFHSSCIEQLALKPFMVNGEIKYLKKRIKNQPMHLYNKGENVFLCPKCYEEFTVFLSTHEIMPEIRRVLAKINFKHNGNNVVHYITDLYEMALYVPLSGMCKDGKINKKWLNQIHDYQRNWYAHQGLNLFLVKQAYSHTVHLFSSSGPDEEASGMPSQITKIIRGGHYILIEIDELDSLLNNDK